MSDKYSAKYWQDQIARSRRDHEDYISAFEKSIGVYKGTTKLDDAERKLNVWSYLVETLIPAYYSKVPRVEAKLRKASGNPIQNASSIAIERATQYQLDECMPFRQIGLNAARSLVLGGRAVLWLSYKAKVTEKESSYGLIRDVNGNFYNEKNEPYDGDPEAIQEESGIYTVSSLIKNKESEELIAEILNYHDFLVDTCRSEHEETWRSKRAFLTRELATEIFGKDIANSLDYSSFPDDKKDRNRDKRAEEGRAELQEIYCIENKKVYWLQEKGEKSFLEVGDPALKFKDFYPCEVIKATTTPDSNIPISDYTLWEDQILEVERLTTRIAACTRAIRTNFAYDAASGGKLEDLLIGDLKGTPCKNWSEHAKSGGLRGMMDFLPIEQYVSALQVLNTARNEALERLYESAKLGEILRGSSDPNQTATAVQLQSDWGSVGLKVKQQMFSEFISNGVAKIGEIICEHFDTNKIYEMANGAELENPEKGITWQGIFDTLRDDPSRRYRIEIATDSMIEINERAVRKDRTDAIASLGGWFSQITPFLEKYPGFAPASVKLSQFVLRTYKEAKELEEPFEQGLAAVVQSSQQQQAQQAQGQPTPGAAEAQAKLQAAQLQAQIDQQKMQLEMQKSQLEAELKREENAIKMASLSIEQDKLHLELAKMQGDRAIQLLEFDSQREDRQMKIAKEMIDTQQARIEKSNGAATV